MNAINVIAPYKHLGLWVFDDPRVGLAQEPFVAGTDTMIDRIVAPIPDAERGFTLIFSAEPFPGHQHRLEWRRAESNGNWYFSPELDMEGWLCPALLRYFSEPPKEIYVQVGGLSGAKPQASDTATETVTLYRPVGPEELDLIGRSSFRSFPPRLPEQPIFYPVLTESYAVTIARDWNVKASGAGYVTRFAVMRSFLDRYAVQDAGGSRHQEYWIPAEDLAAFNDNIVGRIDVVREFHAAEAP